MMPIVVCEVGPRDGLQNHPRHFEVAERVELIDRLSAAGLRRIEAVSFVNDQKVPRMAGAEAVLDSIRRPPGTLFSGLVLNGRGVDRALGCDLQEIRLVVVASDTFSRRNQGASTEDTILLAAEVSGKVKSAGRRFSVVIATAFGCPFEGRVAPEHVAGIARRLAAMGVDEIVLADTIGAATPFEVAALVPLVEAAAPGIPLGCHFHNTRNLGFANAYAAIGSGVRLFDSSIGGLGGCPIRSPGDRQHRDRGSRQHAGRPPGGAGRHRVASCDRRLARGADRRGGARPAQPGGRVAPAAPLQPAIWMTPPSARLESSPSAMPQRAARMSRVCSPIVGGAG